MSNPMFWLSSAPQGEPGIGSRGRRSWSRHPRSLPGGCTTQYSCQLAILQRRSVVKISMRLSAERTRLRRHKLIVRVPNDQDWTGGQANDSFR
ncbi:MAG TPA: hypothetical protein VHP35_06255, partial [Terriglobia bacterium]|nr:hypothetical protein [Terriglobia bacterium]